MLGTGANKTKLKQTLLSSFFSNDMSHANPLFSMLCKIVIHDYSNEDSRWLSWEKFKEMEGETNALQMIKDKSVQERDHPRCKGAKQYQYVEDFLGQPHRLPTSRITLANQPRRTI